MQQQTDDHGHFVGGEIYPHAFVHPTAKADKGKHDCKGKNGCAGEGGCKAGDNGCKGKNSCKGKGGCSTAMKDDKKTDTKKSG